MNENIVLRDEIKVVIVGLRARLEEMKEEMKEERANSA